jgi:hypothetical protein
MSTEVAGWPRHRFFNLIRRNKSSGIRKHYAADYINRGSVTGENRVGRAVE